MLHNLCTCQIQLHKPNKEIYLIWKSIEQSSFGNKYNMKIVLEIVETECPWSLGKINVW